jgi:transcriptional regulator with XRE-family HTH domain
MGEKMISNYLNFGDFITQKHEEKNITLRDIAKKLNITPPYLSDVEKARRNPFDLERLRLIASILLLSEEDKTTMMDLVGKKRNQIAPDLIAYIKERNYVTAALRTARDLDAGEEDWLEFINTLKRKM